MAKEVKFDAEARAKMLTGVDVLADTQPLHQAQILPEGRDRLTLPGFSLCQWGASPAGTALIGVEAAIGNGKQRAFASSTSAQQGNALSRFDAQINSLQTSRLPGSTHPDTPQNQQLIDAHRPQQRLFRPHANKLSG